MLIQEIVVQSAEVLRSRLYFSQRRPWKVLEPMWRQLSEGVDRVEENRVGDVYVAVRLGHVVSLEGARRVGTAISTSTGAPHDGSEDVTAPRCITRASHDLASVRNLHVCREHARVHDVVRQVGNLALVRIGVVAVDQVLPHHIPHHIDAKHLVAGERKIGVAHLSRSQCVAAAGAAEVDGTWNGDLSGRTAKVQRTEKSLPCPPEVAVDVTEHEVD
mmetsp:Transcript_54853/g.151191  ORF Transcript_54853/g.151191 Transcript_54853/m.151191 type:complete len:217 (-) Transcript_54853:624-1274(-)